MDLVIEDLSKTYPNGVQALKDVTLTIKAGMFGLLGPNGAGKSTLMRTIATLQEPDRGRIFLGEIDVLNEKDRVKQVLGYLPQEFDLYPKVTALDLLDHFAVLKGIASRAARREIVTGILQLTNLFEHRQKKLGGFSGGMKQRFGIAQALLGNPRLLIVDEPTAGLDPEERVRFHNLLSEIGKNIVVILSTHIVSDVSVLCSEMAVIHQGQVLLTGNPAALIARLENRIWRKFVEKAELALIAREHRIISTKLVMGRTLIHVYCDERPDETFEHAEADLEDVYFSAIKGYIGNGEGTSTEQHS